jgi:hypothetical protein
MVINYPKCQYNITDVHKILQYFPIKSSTENLPKSGFLVLRQKICATLVYVETFSSHSNVCSLAAAGNQNLPFRFKTLENDGFDICSYLLRLP